MKADRGTPLPEQGSNESRQGKASTWVENKVGIHVVGQVGRSVHFSGNDGSVVRVEMRGHGVGGRHGRPGRNALSTSLGVDQRALPLLRHRLPS